MKTGLYNNNNNSCSYNKNNFKNLFHGHNDHQKSQSCNSLFNHSISNDDINEIYNCSMSPTHYCEWNKTKLKSNVENDENNMQSKHKNDKKSNVKLTKLRGRRSSHRNLRRQSFNENSNNNNNIVPRVNPIFLWVKQNDSHIVEVKCEDYDHRNRIRLTKTPNGWRAIPRTEQSTSSLSTKTPTNSSDNSVELTHNFNSKKNKKKKRKHKKKNKHHYRRKSLESFQNDIKIFNKLQNNNDENNDRLSIIKNEHNLLKMEINKVETDDENEDLIKHNDEEDADDASFHNMINETSKDLMNDIQNIDSIDHNIRGEEDHLHNNLQPVTIMVEDLLDPDDDDNDVDHHNHSDNAINGTELIDSLVKKGCEDNNINNSLRDDDNLMKNNLDDYNDDDDDVLINEEPVVSDIISRLNDSLNSPKCLSFNEAGEIEGISDVFNTNSTNSFDNLSITLADFHRTHINKNKSTVIKDKNDNESNNKIVSPDSCQQDQFHPKDLRVCKINNITKKLLESPMIDLSISRPISRSSDTIQSPQPSGIPAVPPSPDLLFNKNNFVNINHQFKLPTNKIIQKEPLDLGRPLCRKSASPTVSCSQQEPDRLSIESSSPKRIKMEHKTDDNVNLMFNQSSGAMDSLNNNQNCNNNNNNIIDLIEVDDYEEEDIEEQIDNLRNEKNNLSNNKKSSSFINRNNDPDPLTQLRLLVSNLEWKVPDPLLVPKDRLNAILESPAREIPLLLTTRPELRLPEAFSFPNILQDPDIMVVSLSQLEMILIKQDELLKSSTNNINNSNLHVKQVPEIINNSINNNNINNNSSSLKYNHQKPMQNNNINKSKTNIISLSPTVPQQPQQQPSTNNFTTPTPPNLLANNLAGDIDAATMAAFNQMFWLPYPAGQMNPNDLLKIPDVNQFNTNNFPYQNLPNNNNSNNINNNDNNNHINNNNNNNNFNGCPPELSVMLQEAARQMSNNYFIQALKLSQNRWNNNNQNTNPMQSGNNINNNSNNNIKPKRNNSSNNHNLQMISPEFMHPPMNHHFPSTSPSLEIQRLQYSPHRNSIGQNNNSNNNIRTTLNNTTNNNNQIHQQNWNNNNHNLLSPTNHQSYQKMVSNNNQQSSRTSSSHLSNLNNNNLNTNHVHNPFASPPYFPQEQVIQNHQKLKLNHSKSLNNHQYTNNLSIGNKEKPRVTCKSLLNLLQPNNSSHHSQLQRFNSTGSTESISSELEMLTSNNINNNLIHGNNQLNNCNIVNNNQAKLKVKPGSHLLDPAAAQRKLLNDDIADVVSTTSGMDDVLNDPNMSLWHPLFGNAQNVNYTSPWHWTTVTATGE